MIGTVISIAISIIMVLASLALHEAAHILAIKFMGGRVEKISPFPLGFGAKISGLEALRPWERYVIYGSGAAANAAVALWAFITSRLSHTGVAWMDDLAFYNMVLCLFNLVPVLPLDGGQLLQQFLSNRIGILRANRIIIRLGTYIGRLLVVLGLVQIVLYIYNFTLLLAGLYVLKRNKEIKPRLIMGFFRALQAKEVQERARVMPAKVLVLPSSTPVKYVLERLTLDHAAEIISVAPDGSKTQIPERVLIKHVLSYGIRGDIAALTKGHQTQPI